MHHHHHTLSASPHRRRLIRGTALAASAALATGALTLAPAAALADGLGPELVSNGTFDAASDPWWVTEDVVADTSTGALCVDAPGGTPNAWSTIVGLDDIPLLAGESYRFSFRISGTEPVTIRALAQQDRSPWSSTYEMNPTTSADGSVYTSGFTSTLDWPTGQIVFQIGGSDVPWTFCLDDVSFRTGPAPDPYVAETNSRIRVNQYGYLPSGPKRATLLVDDAEVAGLAWTLRDAAGAAVTTGTSEPHGIDRTVASAVHLIEFDAVTATGDGFTLEADGETSYPFSIRQGIYAPLAADALHYFTLARSGIELTADVVGDTYARPAGHLDVAPNLGDSAVGCQAPRDYYQGWTCDDTFDVRGGWYDAGDHGKYVVNGGISLHQVLDTWEVARRAGAENLLADGALRVPEGTNGVPDILDEARWELEWMQRMQVPAGQQYAGLVFHKVQDNAWSGLPTMPWLDDKPRQVHRPSTAAALNFAAVVAKGARLFTEYDADFADELLADARVAWDAAVATPDLFASPADGNDGGGPYDDQHLGDEFSWAAAELFLATGDEQFADFLISAAEWEKGLGAEAGLDWRDTLALGLIDLALVDSDFAERDAVRAVIVAAADGYLGDADSAFQQPYRPRDGEYDWGSNAIILNNQVILAAAAEITGDARYTDAVVTAMDYLLGRNGVDLSYVTGYGTAYAQNQHHRWMAPSLGADLPPIAPGTVSGGPNSAINDPVAQQAWPDGCVAQLCYLDDIQSWSTNEMTINWNAALSWVSVWIAARADTGDARTASTLPAWASPVVTSVALVVALGASLVSLGRRESDAVASGHADTDGQDSH